MKKIKATEKTNKLEKIKKITSRFSLNTKDMLKIVSIVTSVLFVLELVTLLSSAFVGLKAPSSYYNLVEMVSSGLITPILLALVLVLVPLGCIILWLRGAEKRAIATQLIMIWLAFIFANVIAVYFSNLWDGFHIFPYPWLVYRFLLIFHEGTIGFNHLLICLLLSYALFAAFVGLLFMRDLLTGLTQAQKTHGNAHFANAFEIKKAGLFSEAGIILGKAHGKLLKLPGFESVLAVAPTGSGKTSAIAIPNLLQWQGSVVANDLKGELCSTTKDYREHVLDNVCFVWAPANANKETHCYNPFAYVNKNPDLRIRDLQLIAETLIPATQLGDAFWYQSSREIFITLALYLFETKGMATLGEVHDLSKNATLRSWLGDIAGNDDNNLSKTLIQNIAALIAASDDTFKNVLKDFHSRISLFADPIIRHATRRNDFDFSQLRQKKVTVYINIPVSDRERLTPILTLFWTQLIDAMTTQEPDPVTEPYGVLALIDEFGNMAKINKLKDGMSFLRAYHVRCVIIVQYLAQINAIYGREEAKGFLNSKVKVAFALNDLGDAQFFSQALGKKAVKISSKSISSGSGNQAGGHSVSHSYQSRSLLMPDEVMKLPKNQAIILMESQFPVKAKKCYWYQ